ncbi:MAG: hypothetical protein PHW09_03635, partial [Desulfovibrio desulfuricans]|nr:hypothetical protein [Desulfovibrio desulfuricans]
SPFRNAKGNETGHVYAPFVPKRKINYLNILNFLIGAIWRIFVSLSGSWANYVTNCRLRGKPIDPPPTIAGGNVRTQQALREIPRCSCVFVYQTLEE